MNTQEVTAGVTDDPIELDAALALNEAEHATVLAALTLYKQQGMGDPMNRSDDVHEIATNGGLVFSSLDDEGIDRLLAKAASCQQKPVRYADKALGLATAIQLASAGKDFSFKVDGEGVVLSVAAVDAAALAEPAAPAFALVQEGGSSDELYLHSHPNEDDAVEDRYSCAEDGSYRTSQVVEIPPALAALGEVFYETAESLLKASAELECAERPSMGMR